MNASLNHQLLRLTGLLQLEQRARHVRGRELAFLIANETMGVLPYQQAVLWLADKAGPAAVVLSGVAEPGADSAYRSWADGVVAALRRGKDAARIHDVNRAELPAGVAAAWTEWFPENAVWCPLLHPDGRTLGALLLGRADHWDPVDHQVLELLSAQYGQCLALDSLRGRRLPRLPRGSWRLAGLAVAAAAAAAVLVTPVRRSVIAPAEVVSIAPAPVRAPFEGVVAAIHVAPNATVHAGDRLVSLERTQLQTQQDVAAKALEMARVEYVVTSQQAMSDPQAKAKLALLAGKVEQRAAELAYAKGMLERSDLSAPIDGVAVFGTVAEWIGKPVAVGERIMQVASPTQTQLEIEVPAADAVTFDTGSEVLFFNNISPDAPVRAVLDYASYGAAPTADGTMAYTFRARFAGAAAQRLGTKGSAKIFGPEQPLALWLLRRPVAVLRQWLAL